MDPNSLALLMGSAGAAAGPATYVEDVFQTWLYTGNSSTQTITNGIDLAGKGGMVWLKDRDAANVAGIYDTVRGVSQRIVPSATNAQATTSSAGVNQFNSDGFQLASGLYNQATEVSWTFRKQAKFFDVTTATQTTGNTGWLTFNHNLGSVPGAILIKVTSTADNWFVYHRSTSSQTLILNLANAASATVVCQNVTSTSFEFNLANYGSGSGSTYVAYLFAHDAGGFGATGNDSVIKCGTFTCDASGNVGTVSLGWEPQWILTKRTDATQNWFIWDTMRDLTLTSSSYLSPNLAAAEGVFSGSSYLYPTATGFAGSGNAFGPNASLIYIAIRRGPMKTPTDATKVFGQVSRSGTGANATVTGGQVADLAIVKNYDGTTDWLWASRLTGTGYLSSAATTAETAAGTTILQANPWDVMDGIKVGTTSLITNGSGGYTYINWLLRRAPGFFDVVAYTGTGSATTVSHNLGVVPQMMIIKGRSNAFNWAVYHAGIGDTLVVLNKNFDGAPSNWWNSASHTATSITLPNNDQLVSGSGVNYIAYLFASCPGVSKVGSYTGTGTTLSIDCGFTAGARFVMIKRTDNTGDWYIWDTAHGIVSANEPFILFNSTGSGQYGYDYIDPLSSGFQISSTAPAAINANGGSYIYLSVA